MLLPKSKKRTNKDQQQCDFSELIIGLDGRCMNPDHRKATDGLPAFLAMLLTAHHIKRRGQGGQNVAENGICFCAICHEFAEGVGNLKDRDGKRISGFDFIIFVLAYWEGKPEYRWEEIHEELRLRLV